MKKIILLSFTFLGICSGFTQIPSANDVTQIQKPVSDSIPKEKAAVKLFPNPAKNKIELEVNGFNPGMVQLQIINVSGKMVRNDSRLLFSGNETIVVMFSLTPGIYFITIKQKDKLVKKKMVVQ